MANGCSQNTALGSLEAQMFQSLIMEDVDYAIDKNLGTLQEAELSFKQFGKQGEEALKEYKATREYIKETVNLFAQIIGYSNLNKNHINGLMFTLADIVQEYTGVLGVRESLVTKANPREAISAFKLMRNAIAMQRKKILKARKGNKVLNAFERAFFLPHFAAARISIGGDVYRYIKRLQFFAEDVRKASHKFRQRYANAKREYYTALFNYLMQKDLIGPEYVMDGVEVTNGIFRGSIKKNGVVYHLIEDENGNVQEVSEDALSKDEIVEAVSEKYMGEFADDILSGQTRYIHWTTKPDKAWRDYVFRKIKDKKADPEDFKAGMPEIHNFKVGDTIYYFTMKKRGKRGKDGIFTPELDKFGREVYDAFILWEKPKNGKAKSWSGHISKSAYEKLGLSDGYYKAQRDRKYGKKYNPKTGRVYDDGRVERGFDFSNIHNLRIEPHPDLLALSATEGTTGFWQHIQLMRSLYRQIGFDLQSRYKRISKRYTDAMGKLFKLIQEHPDRDILNQLEGILNLGMRLSFDKDGNIIAPNAGFSLLSDNYSPLMFDKYELILTVENRLENARIRLIESQSAGEDTKELADDIAKLEAFLKTLVDKDYTDKPPETIKDLFKYFKVPTALSESAQEAYTRLVIGSNIAHMEHRATWTDRTRRRKDLNVFYDYIDQTYYALKKQELLLDLINLAHDRIVTGTGGQKGEIIDWLINRTRIQFRDPYHEAHLGPFDISYASLAKKLNKLKIFGHHDAESIERFITSTRAMFAGVLLGASVGLVNRSQFINSVIRYGWKLYRQADRIVDGLDKRLTREQLDAIMDYLGVDEIVNIFTEWISRGDDIGLRDAMAVPLLAFGPIQAPGPGAFKLLSAKARERAIGLLPVINRAKQLSNYNRIKHRARRLAAKKTEIFNSLTGLEKAKVEQFVKLYESYRKKLQSPSERQQVEDALEALYDYILSGKADKNGIPYQKLKNALPGVTETILRRAVSWKVSWMPFTGARALLTMTESERVMRRTDAMMALLFAAERGYLGKYSSDFTKLPQKEIAYVDKDTGEKKVVKVPSIFVSDAAVRIARNSVYSTMFGLSIYHQGEAFAGLGQQLFLYKTYPLNQTVHDYKILKQFFASGPLTLAIPRLLKGFGDIATGKTKNPAAKNVDWPAVRVARFIMSRLAMTGVLVFMETIPMLRRVLFTVNSPVTSGIRSLVMGGESPLFRIAIRMLLNILIFSSFDTDDKDEKRLIYDVLDIVRLFFPVFITYPAYLLKYTYDKLN